MAATTAFSFASLAKALPSSNVGSSSCSMKGSRVSWGGTKSASCVVRYRPLKTSMMAKREVELEEVRKMSDQELKDNIIELKGELLILRMKKVARQEIKSSEFVRMQKRGPKIDLNLPRRRLQLSFTCDACGARSQRLINPDAYARGTVFVQCEGCEVYHKLVDNLGLIEEYDFRQEANNKGDVADLNELE